MDTPASELLPGAIVEVKDRNGKLVYHFEKVNERDWLNSRGERFSNSSIDLAAGVYGGTGVTVTTKEETDQPTR